MKSRALTSDDLEEVRKLHYKYFPEFDFPNFLHFLNAFIIEDKDGSIIMAGGVELVAEAVLVTNKAKGEIKIGKALVEAQQIATFTCQKFGIRDLYAFVNNDIYAKHLIQHGFHNGHRALTLRVG